MSRPAETAAARQARLATIRQQIQAGGYETRERLSMAVDAKLVVFANQLDGAEQLGGASEQAIEPVDDAPLRRRRPK